MHFADPSAFFIDGADFSRQDEPGRSKVAAHLVRQAEFFLQTVKTFFRRDQLFSQFCSPGRMGKVPRPQKLYALAARPKIQMGQVAVPAGGAGIF